MKSFRCSVFVSQARPKLRKTAKAEAKKGELSAFIVANYIQKLQKAFSRKLNNRV